MSFRKGERMMKRFDRNSPDEREAAVSAPFDHSAAMFPDDDPASGGTEDFVFADGEPPIPPQRSRKRLLLLAAAAAAALAIIAAVWLLGGNKDGADDAGVKLSIGRTWTVGDQWSLTINSVRKTNLRNTAFSRNGDCAGVYIIDYTYTNINYRSDKWGLYFSLASGAADSAGETCVEYVLDGLSAPAPLAPGESVTCRQAIAVYHDGGFTVSETKYADAYHGEQAYPFTFTFED